MSYYSSSYKSSVIHNGKKSFIEIDKNINNGKEIINIHYDDNGKKYNETILNNIRKHKENTPLEITLKQNHLHNISHDMFHKLFGNKKKKSIKRKTKKINKKKSKKKEII